MEQLIIELGERELQEIIGGVKKWVFINGKLYFVETGNKYTNNLSSTYQL